MRKSHRQKVADRKAKRRAAGAEKHKLNDFLSRANLCVKGHPRMLTWLEVEHLLLFGFPEDTNPSAEPTEKGE